MTGAAERLLADGVRRFPGYQGSWTPMQQRLAQARAERDRQARMDEARRLILEARRLAALGDFADAERLLQEADQLSPGFAETARARTEIAQMRAERGQRYRERYQYNAAIEQALSIYALWEAERLTTEALQRFPNDPGFRAQADQIARMRQQAEWQSRVSRARPPRRARRAMERGDFFEAERQMALADELAPGLPEANQMRADLSRARVRAETQNDQIRWLMAAIEAAILGASTMPTASWPTARRAIPGIRAGPTIAAGWRRAKAMTGRCANRASGERASAPVAQARQTAAGHYTAPRRC
jgi:tetratricopeptide (TPR) repeat protein